MGSAPAPVLILAARETGGSLLASLLGAHPEFCAAPHLNVLSFDYPWQQMQYCLPPRDANFHGLLRFIAEAQTAEQTLLSVQTALRWLSERKAMPAPDLHARLRGYVAPARLVEFSPLVSQNRATMARAIAALPDDSVVIHLTRDPVAYGEALSIPVWQTLSHSLDFWDRRGLLQPVLDIYEIGEQFIDWSTIPPVFDPQFVWYRTHTAAEAAIAALPEERRLRLPVEALVARPQETLQDLLVRLGADADPVRVAQMLSAGISSFDRPGPYIAPFCVDFEMIGTSVGDALRNRGAPSPRRARSDPAPCRGDGEPLLDEVVALAEELGYEFG